MEQLEILIILWTIWSMDWEGLFAYPAPFMLAYLTNHVRTPSLFFYFDTTVCACPNSLRVWLSPFLIPFVNLLFARFAWVPWVQATIAEDLLALKAARRRELVW